jgi:hypothetical protein
MKKIILFTTCIVILFTACKKSKSNNNTPAPNTVQMTLGGINYTFSKILIDTTFTGANGTTLYAELADDTTEYANLMTLAFADPVALGVKTYTDTTSIPQAAFEFEFDGISHYDYSNVGNKISPLIVSVTAISPTSIQGTFSGTIYLNGDIAEDQKYATGKFNLSR